MFTSSSKAHRRPRADEIGSDWTGAPAVVWDLIGSGRVRCALNWIAGGWIWLVGLMETGRGWIGQKGIAWQGIRLGWIAPREHATVWIRMGLGRGARRRSDRIRTIR